MSCPPKLTMMDFHTDEEAKAWVELKAPFGHDPDKMPRLDKNNWKLSEYWFVWDGGMDISKTSIVEEKMDRIGIDVSSGLAVLGIDNGDGNGKKQKTMSNMEKHKALLC